MKKILIIAVVSINLFFSVKSKETKYVPLLPDNCQVYDNCSLTKEQICNGYACKTFCKVS